ncbi:uncharacterized protein LOC116121363 [Pistacia vera]|uniref:uncharacterized protein LOC116121363 n=1 Tax=Pistacia vera TaxID=55513 RepID=UPI001262D3B9|nr:uncharacterized protein LOC116121363 [Pistacia vera]
MITRSKSHIATSKYQALVSLSTILSEPKSVTEALQTPECKHAMENEYQALLKNKTWELVPYEEGMNVVGSKWVFKTKFNSDVVTNLNNKFALKTLAEVQYFLGFEVKRSNSGLLLTQTKYAHDLLQKAGIQDCKPCLTPMATGLKLAEEDDEIFYQPTLYRSIIGGLQYLILSRPDLAFSINKLSQFLQHRISVHWTACKRVLRYVKGTLEHGILFTGDKLFTLEAFSYADWARDVTDHRSTSSYSVFLGGNLIQWSSRKSKVVSFTSTEVEYM